MRLSDKKLHPLYMISAPAVSRGDILNSAPRFMVVVAQERAFVFSAISWESMEVNGISNNKSRKNALFFIPYFLSKSNKSSKSNTSPSFCAISFKDGF